MTPVELAEAAREVRARYRTAQGLPPTLEDPAVCDLLAGLIDNTPTTGRVAS